MGPEKVHGVVLRYANYREADRILTLFTGERGQVTAAARGCRKPSGKLRAACDYLIFGEFMLRPVGSGLSVTACTVLDSFFELRADMNTLCCAFYLRDFCETVIGDGQPHPELFSLLVRSLGALCHGKAPCDTVRTAFEIRAMDLLGLGPSLDRCVVCGAQTEKPAAFSVPGGGSVCRECHERGEGGTPVLAGSIAALRMLRRIDWDSLRLLSPAQAVARDLNGFWRDYIVWYLDRRFREADFAQKLDRYLSGAGRAYGKPPDA